jgi:hypothetical protein
MLTFVAILTSLARWFIFPFSDYPDAWRTYPQSLLGALFSLGDYNFENSISILPSSPVYSIIFGSIYVHPPQVPVSISFWFASSLPFISFAVISDLYVHFISRKEIQPLLNRILALFFLCPSSAYYLCTFHPEVWANLVALFFVLFILASYSERLVISPNNLEFNISSKTVLSPLWLIACCSFLLYAYFYTKDKQFILCAIGILLLYSSLIYLPSSLKFYPRNLAVAACSIIRSGSVGKKLLFNILLYSLPIIPFYLLIYQLRDLLASFSPDANLASAARLYLQDSIYSNKYPLIFRPFMTLNNFYVYTPAGFTPSIFVKIGSFLSLFQAWFIALRSSSQTISHLASSLSFVLLYPLVLISIFPGYVNLKYYVFLVPVLLFFPAIFRYKSMLAWFYLLWLELILRYLITSL